jgi:hypothetical protein
LTAACAYSIPDEIAREQREDERRREEEEKRRRDRRAEAEATRRARERWERETADNDYYNTPIAGLPNARMRWG